MTKNNKEKSFGRLAFERLISNLLSVKVWLFIIPVALSAFFLWWSIDLMTDTTIMIQQSLDNQSGIVELTKIGMNNIKDMFSSWLKFTGSMIATVIGVREVWKVAKIKEDRKTEKMRQDKENK